ncbi:MAG: DUF5329 family protein, partial [Planctomycetes bacterium]|nr:DUF5329 family protein [Planctomycetota bacterium]
MTRCQTWGGSVFALVVMLAAQGLHAAEKLATETDKIEALISHVEGLEGARFLVAKRSFQAPDAAKFLRWSLSQNKVRTAEEFITKVATHYMNRPFSIRLGNGKTMRSSEYLRGELKKLDGLPTEELTVALKAKEAEPKPQVAAKQPAPIKQAVPQAKPTEQKKPEATPPAVE